MQRRLCCLYVWLVMVQAKSPIAVQSVTAGLYGAQHRGVAITDQHHWGTSLCRVSGSPALGLTPSSGLHSLLQQGHLDSSGSPSLVYPTLASSGLQWHALPGNGILKLSASGRGCCWLSCERCIEQGSGNPEGDADKWVPCTGGCGC